MTDHKYGGKSQPPQSKNDGEQTAKNSPEEGNMVKPDMTGNDIVDKDAEDPSGRDRQKTKKQTNKEKNEGEQGGRESIDDAIASKMNKAIEMWRRFGFHI